MSKKSTLYATYGHSLAHGETRLRIYDREKAETLTVIKTNAAGKVLSKTTEQVEPELLTSLCRRAAVVLKLTKGRYRLDVTATKLGGEKKK